MLIWENLERFGTLGIMKRLYGTISKNLKENIGHLGRTNANKLCYFFSYFEAQT